MKMTREQIIKEVGESFLASLREIDVELSPDAICSFSQDGVTLGIIDSANSNKMQFASEIHITVPSNVKKVFGIKKESLISFGTSGSFNPSNRASYWRTIHAASILKNWEKACEVVNSYCKQYGNLL